MTRKVVINTRHGGFGLSREAQDMYCAQKGIDPGEWSSFGTYENFHEYELERDDPVLVDVVERLGEQAGNYNYSSLKIVEIPEDVKWTIEEYDGAEWVAEVHRTWS